MKLDVENYALHSIQGRYVKSKFVKILNFKPKPKSPFFSSSIKFQ